MKLLAIETSGKLCGASVLIDDKIIDKLEINNGLTHSESLMPLIQELLERNNLKIKDFDAFVCDIGPGSFTGIRIGVATIKAFVDTFESTKYTGVSSLEALAYNVHESGLICSIVDCKNENCYFALYNLENGKYIEVVPPTASSVLDMFEILRKYSLNSITFVGDGSIMYKDVIISNMENSRFLSDSMNNIDTSNLALAGFNKISNGDTVELSPMYLKKPQAQRQLEEKLKKD